MKRAALEDLEDQVGQLLWIGFEGTDFEGPLRNLIHRVRPGGVILFGRNIQDATQVRRLTDALFAALPVPPFIALDQEGGRVSRLRPILGPTPSALSLAARESAPRAVTRSSAATARVLRALGFNLNFAPVLDLSDADASNGIGDRGFGKDPRRVTALGHAAIRAHLAAGILPVGKHFPGLGSARADTHLSLPIIDTPRRAIWERDLLPYRRLGRSLPAVMIGHARYPAIQGKETGPASLSPAVVDALLRRRLGYRGLVLTDDLEMGAVDQRLDGGAQSIAAFAAGSDGLMFCRSEARILEARDGLIETFATGRLPRRRLEDSLRRILALKSRFLLARRRGRLSAATLDRARRTFASFGPAAGGFDPTARA